jgi:cytoskeletal protein CcmA (bactofilin family)
MVSRAIQIAENGAFNGKVDVDVAEIRGEFAGEMTARKKLVVHASGRVSGKIRYGKMLVQEGGELSGDIAALDSQSVQLVR